MPDQDAKKPAKAEYGKPTIEPSNHDQNFGQRERTHSVGGHGKPTIDPDTHDANVGQRDPIDEDEVDESDVDKTRGQQPTRDSGDTGERDAVRAPGGESHIAPNSTLSDDREVE